MLQFIIDTIFVMFGGCAFQQKVGIPKGTNCVLLLVELFIYSYEADVIQRPPKKKYEKLARSFNFTFHYTDGILSLNYSTFNNMVNRIYSIGPEIKDTTDPVWSA
jgi:hypothetical protein